MIEKHRVTKLIKFFYKWVPDKRRITMDKLEKIILTVKKITKTVNRIEVIMDLLNIDKEITRVHKQEII